MIKTAYNHAISSFNKTRLSVGSIFSTFGLVEMNDTDLETGVTDWRTGVIQKCLPSPLQSNTYHEGRPYRQNGRMHFLARFVFEALAVFTSDI